MNVSEITERVELPGGHAMIRMLSAKQRRDARNTSSSAAVRLIADMGGDVMKALREMDSGEPTDQTDDPLQGLDQEKVLEFGVSQIMEGGKQIYPAPVSGPGAHEIDVPAMDRQVLDNLSEPVAETLAHAIVALSGRTSAEGKD